jgi:chromosome segregation ATPase
MEEGVMSVSYEDAKNIAMVIVAVAVAIGGTLKARSSIQHRSSRERVVKIYDNTEASLLDRLQKLANDSQERADAVAKESQDRADVASEERYQIAVRAAGLEAKLESLSEQYAGLSDRYARLEEHTRECEAQIEKLQNALSAAQLRIEEMQKVIDRRLKPRRE